MNEISNAWDKIPNWVSFYICGLLEVLERDNKTVGRLSSKNSEVSFYSLFLFE